MQVTRGGPCSAPEDEVRAGRDKGSPQNPAAVQHETIAGALSNESGAGAGPKRPKPRQCQRGCVPCPGTLIKGSHASGSAAAEKGESGSPSASFRAEKAFISEAQGGCAEGRAASRWEGRPDMGTPSPRVGRAWTRGHRIVQMLDMNSGSLRGRSGWRIGRASLVGRACQIAREPRAQRCERVRLVAGLAGNRARHTVSRVQMEAFPPTVPVEPLGERGGEKCVGQDVRTPLHGRAV